MADLTLNIIIAVITAWFITKFVIQYADAIGMIEDPNHRSSHKKQTPHGGGISIVITTALITLWLLWRDDVNYPMYIAAIALALLIGIKGFLDDIFHLSASLRLVIQFFACLGLLIAIYILPLNGLEPLGGLPIWIAFTLILLSGIWWLNLFNFMDGIDGLAAMQAIFMLVAAALLSLTNHPTIHETTLWIWILCLAAATFGFLLHNWAPAKIFMGDTGSLFLAFMILFIALATISLQWMNYAAWAILGAVFISDASLTLFRRILAGQKLSEAHRNHAYQKLAARWQSHAKVTLLVAAINILWLLPLAWLSLKQPDHSHFWLLLAYLPIGIGVWALGAGKSRTTGHFTHYVTSLKRPEKQWLMAMTDSIILMAAATGAYFLRIGTEFSPNHVQLFLIALIPIITIPIFVRLGLYRSIIRYVGKQALWSILHAVTLSAIIWTAIAFLLAVSTDITSGLPRAVPFIYWGLAIVAILSIRFTLRWLLWTSEKAQSNYGEQVLIYGAGNTGQQLAASLRKGTKWFPVGFLDDYSQLQGQDLDELRVYSPHFLPELIESFGIQHIIVAIPSASMQRQNEIVTFLEKYSVNVQLATRDAFSGIIEEKIAIKHKEPMSASSDTLSLVTAQHFLSAQQTSTPTANTTLH